MEVLARKIGCTRLFDSEGLEHPVTILSLIDSFVVDVRSREKHGYHAVVVGFDPVPLARVNKPTKGWLIKNGLETGFKSFRELKGYNEHELKLGSKIIPSWLVQGSFVDCSGKSKGRGFTGVLKRHNMSGPPATRGTHEARRNVGSIGCRKYPGRVFKGKRLPGRYGNETVTVLNLEVMKILPEDGIIAVKGSVPGPKNGIIKIRPAIKKAGRS